MTTTRFRFCLTAAATLHADDLDAVTAKIEAYRAAGMSDEMSERAAVDDVIAQGEGEFGDIGKLLREQHPDLFVAGNEVAKTSAIQTAAGRDVMPAGLTVTFGGKSYPVESINDAQEKWVAFRDSADDGMAAGVSQVGNGIRVSDGAGRFVARISYNGRAWDGEGDNAKVLAEAPDRLPMPVGVNPTTAQTYLPPRETLEQARERSRKAVEAEAAKESVAQDTTKVDRFYAGLLPKASTKLESSSAGRSIYSVNITPQMANRQGVQFGRWPETDSFRLVARADVTGRPGDQGWLLIDKREQQAAQAAANVREQEDPPAITEAQARKQFEWRNLGQKDGTKTHGLFFFVAPEDKGTGRAMGRGTVELFQGASGWKVDGEGQSYKALADAKAAAIEAAIPVLRDQGWIAPAAEAAGPKIGDMVKLTKSGLQGPVNIAGRVERILPDGRLEIRTQNDGIMVRAESELGHKPKPAAAPKPDPTTPVVGEDAAIRQAKDDLNAALGDLGALLSKNTRLNITPEQEQALLPVLTRVFDAAFRLGHLQFKAAARFVIDLVREKFGPEVAGMISLQHLQGSFIGASGPYLAQGADPIGTVATFASLADLAAAAETGVKTEAPQVDSNGFVADPDASPDLNRTPSGRMQSGGGIDVDALRRVDALMLDIAQDPEVLKAVVRSIPVDVVNMLGGRERTADRLLNDPSVLIDLATTSGRGDQPVASRIQAARSVVEAVAPFATEAARTAAQKTVVASHIDAALSTLEQAHTRIVGDQHVPDTNADLERDRSDAAPDDATVGGPVQGDGLGDGAAAPRIRTGSSRRGRPSEPGVSPRRAPPAGERGDQPVDRADGADQPQEFTPGGDDAERSGDAGIGGIPADPIAAAAVDATAQRGMDAAVKLRAQRAAESVAIKPGDLANIRETLPYLMREQQEDVHKAETQFAKPDGYGMLFTNGTGTGKTFTGLGVIKRLDRQGKGNILIVVPSEKVLTDWVESGRALGLTITALADTKAVGEGVTITTYANFGQNNELPRREWDHVLADEAHMLKQSAEWEGTNALDALRALTWHPDGVYPRLDRLMADEIAERGALAKQIEANERIRNLDDTMDAMRDSIARENEKLRARWSVLHKLIEAEKAKIQEATDARQGLARPRATFLSATPFAYEETVVWANGYLFDMEEGYPEDMRTSSAYNNPSPLSYFFMQHFGWRMRYGKLTKPNHKVDRGLLDRQFNKHLKTRGSLSGRMLNVDKDYDRRFVLAESNVGNEIDRAIEWIREQSKAHYEAHKGDDKGPPNGYAFLDADLDEALFGTLGHLTRRYLLEAIKAKEVVPLIREHLAMGRKVVVFHDFKKGGSSNPFEFTTKHADPTRRDLYPAVAAYNTAAAAFRTEFPSLSGDLMADLISPIDRFRNELGEQAMVVNGDEKPKDRLARFKRFNDDASGPQVLLVQSAMNAGWSGHDTTGKHPRVLFNLGLPTTPATAIQQEGRIYRVGQASDAMFRYLNTGTNWERWAFAKTIASRTAAVEDLGMGEQARALRDGFIAAFEESGDFRAGHENEGKGGKDRDRLTNDALTEYDRAKAFYWATQKKDSRTKAKEGVDYFATPEPVGLKMVEWADARPGEDALEPSAGHGAIARWFGDLTKRTAIEPSTVLASRLALVFEGEVKRMSFEDLHIVNKYDAVAMNPPYGTAGRTAIDHLAKAATHLRDFGRVVALIPTGPAADKKFDKWFYEEAERPVKPLGTIDIGMGPQEIYRGDTVKTDSRTAFATEGIVVRREDRGGRFGVNEVYYVKIEGRTDPLAYEPQQITAVARTGKRTETFKPADGLHLVADIKLPGVTFERAGTGVMTRIVVIDKLPDGTAPQGSTIKRDYTGAKSVEELFDLIENVELPKRLKPAGAEDAEPVSPRDAKAEAKAKKQHDQAQGDTAAAAAGLPVIEHTVQKSGKVIKGVVVTHMSDQQYQALTGGAFIWRKNGGLFVKLSDLPAMMEKFPPPPSVASEERAVYAVREQDGQYDLDLGAFGLVPQESGDTGRRTRRPAAKAGNAQPAATVRASTLAVRANPAMPGLYTISSQLVEVGQRELPVARVTNWQEAASALGAMRRYAVEHLDALITDKAGKPLAVVGAFKGAIAQTSVYPATVLAEALRIEGAAFAWGVHNHPSGKTDLSRSDEHLSATLGQSFAPSTVKWMGLAAVGEDRFSAVSPNGDIQSGALIESARKYSVPVVERTIERIAPAGWDALESPAQAKRIAAAMADGKPGIMFVNSQHVPTAFVPVNPGEMGALRDDGRFDRLINSAAESGAGAVIIANPSGVISPRTLDNIASALALTDIRVLDVVDTVAMTSAAERGDMPRSTGTVFSRTRRDFLIGAAATAATNAEAGTTLGKAKPIPAALLTADLPANIQKLLRGNGATTLRGAEVLGQALREMAATGPAELRALASQIAGLLPTSGVMLTVDDRRTVNAHGAVSHNVGGPHMMLFTAGGRKGLTAGTFLHEALHVAVLARYKSLSSGLSRSNDALFKMTAPQAAAQLEQFRALWREFGTMAKESISKVTDPALRLSIEEAHDSPDEFFVRALTDEKLQAWMAGVEYQGKSLLQRFKDWVVGLFVNDGVRPSWLDAALLASNELAAAMPADKADFARMRASAALREEGADSKSTMPGKTTETLAFRQWFGRSKITDEQGKPRVMYHGTGQDITTFKPKQAGAIFLTDEPYFAEQYANTSTKWMEHRGEEGAANILPLYVKAENPFDYENPAQVQAVIAKALELHGRPLGDGQMAIFDPEFKTQTLSSALVLEYGMLAGDNWSLLESKHIQDAIKALGHDSFWVNEGGFKNLGVYSPSQVKSATGNRGTFDGSSEDIRLQRVWHGTPHKVDRFSTDFIGTGEGNQAYGYGLYFAGKKEVADYYRKALSGDGSRTYTKDGKTLEATVDLMEAYYKPGRLVRGYSGTDKVLEFKITDGGVWMVQVVGTGPGGQPMRTERPRWHRTQPDAPTLKSVLEEDGWKASKPGNLYAVEIPEDSEMLLWDRPLSEHPAKVRDALAPFIARYTESQRQIMSGFSAADVEREIQISQRTITGQGIYEQAGYMEGGDRGASEYLLGLGVRGIKYLDGTSRAAGAGAHNYVIFSGDDTAILGDGLSDPDTFYSRIHTPEQLAALAKAGQRPARTMRQSIAAGWQNMTATLANRGEMGHEAIQNTLDQFHGIDRAVKRDVGDLDHNADPYITARLANGGVGSVMRALLLHGQAEWSANGQHLQKKDGTVGLLQILEPLKNDLPDWFGWMAGNRAARLKREGKENNFTDDDIRELKGLAGTPERERLFKDVARQYAEFKRSVLDIGEAAGIIDATTRPVWDHADYIPFFRLVDEKATFSPTGKKGLAGQSSGIRQLRGGAAALNDPIENLLMGFSRIIDASLKNNALDKTLAALEGASSPAIDRATYDMKPALVLKSGIKQQLLDAGTDPMLVDLIPDDAFDGIAKMWAIQAPTDKDVIRVMRDGKPVYFRVLDPLLLKAATSFVPFDMPGLGLARLAKRVLTGAVTATPDFMIRNWVRDSLSVLGIARDRVMPWQSVQGVWKAAAETGGAEAMMFAGASFQGGNIGGHDPTTSARAIRRALRQKGLDASATDSFMRSLVDKPARAWDLYRKLGEAVENSNREAVYEATMARSGNATSAAFEAKDLMDFSLRGSHPVYQVAADVLPFFNARVQGLYRLGRADPVRLAAYGGIVAMLSVLLWAANSGEPWYERLEDWDKDGYWHFKVGGEHFRIPKPFEVGAIFGTIPERIARVTVGTDSATKFGHRLLAVLHDQLAFDPVPQLVRPAANVWANKDTFRDRPIETAGDEKQLPHMRFSGMTSATMRTATRELADLGIDLSPKKLEYLMGGYLGTSGLYALGLSDMAVRAIEGYPPRPTMRTDELPVVRSFYQQDPARSTVFESDLYKLREKADDAFTSMRKAAKAGDAANVQRLQKLHAEKIQAAPTLNAVAAALAKFNQQRDAIYADKAATPDQKRQALDRLQVQRNELTRRAMQSPGLQSLQ